MNCIDPSHGPVAGQHGLGEILRPMIAEESQVRFGILRVETTEVIGQTVGLLFGCPERFDLGLRRVVRNLTGIVLRDNSPYFCFVLGGMRVAETKSYRFRRDPSGAKPRAR